MVKERELDTRMNDLSQCKLFSAHWQNGRGTQTLHKFADCDVSDHLIIESNQSAKSHHVEKYTSLGGIGDYDTIFSTMPQEYKKALWLVSHLRCSGAELHNSAAAIKLQESNHTVRVFKPMEYQGGEERPLNQWEKYIFWIGGFFLSLTSTYST